MLLSSWRTCFWDAFWYVHPRFMLFSSFQGDVCCCPVDERPFQVPFDMFIQDLYCCSSNTQFSKEMHFVVQLSNILLRCLLICSSEMYIVFPIFSFPRNLLLLCTCPTGVFVVRLDKLLLRFKMLSNHPKEMSEVSQSSSFLKICLLLSRSSTSIRESRCSPIICMRLTNHPAFNMLFVVVWLFDIAYFCVHDFFNVLCGGLLVQLSFPGFSRDLCCSQVVQHFSDMFLAI